MILDDIKDIKSSDSGLKKFGVTLGIFFLLFGLLWLWKSKPGAFYWFELASFFLIFAFLAPRFLRLAQKVWMTFALLIGWVMTRVILGVVFYFILTPISLVARWTGKQFLDTKNLKGSDSTWVIRAPADRNKEDCEKQY